MIEAILTKIADLFGVEASERLRAQLNDEKRND